MGHCFEKLTTKPLREQVAEAIRNAILEGDLSPTDEIPEQRLADQFGVSRVPVRDAFRILEQQSLVEIRPRIGSFVKQMTLEELYDSLCVRASLEELAVQQTLERLNPEQWQELCNRLESILHRMRSLVDQPDFSLAIRKNDAALDTEWHGLLIESAHNETLSQIWPGLMLLTRLIVRSVVGIPSIEMWSKTIRHHEELLEAFRRRKADEAKQAIRFHILRRVSQLLDVELI